jgi:transcriptional repressor NrdR
MLCTRCNSDQVRVIDSRSSNQGTSIRRRRECVGCCYRYTTYEVAESIGTEVIKVSGTRQPFDRDKLSTKIALACHKTDIGPIQIEQVVDLISDRVQSQPTITSKELRQRVLQSLKPLSTMAYARFSSVYHRAQTARDMVNILSRA